MSFDAVMGNASVKELLQKNLDSGRIGHAYIFEGRRGVGRMTMAKAFAAGILKVQDPTTHPDFTVVTNALYDPSKQQNTLLIETVRRMKKDVYIKPYSAERKVYVIPFADTMQAPAQNSLLKIFEEPPAYCTMILLAENANAFLPTILSRAPVLRMHPLRAEQVEAFLIKEKGLPKEQAGKLAILSGGMIGRALELLEDADATALREETLSHLLSVCDGDYQKMYDFVRFLKQHRSEIALVMEVLLSWNRDAMHRKLRLSSLPANADKTEQLEKFCGHITREAAVHLPEITAKYQRIIEQNANYSAAVLCMVLEYWEEIHGRNYRS